MKDWVNKQNIPGRLREMLTEFIPDETVAMRHVADWEESDRLMLVLIGGVGTGKTIAAADMVFRKGGKFLTASEFSRVSLYDDDLSVLERCRLLLLDDLGMEYIDDKGHMAAKIDGLLNARYMHGVRTIITTNSAPSLLGELYGPRVVDRIREVGRVRSCGTTSMRGNREMSRARRLTCEGGAAPLDDPPPPPMTHEQIGEMADRFLEKFKAANGKP